MWRKRKKIITNSRFLFFESKRNILIKASFIKYIITLLISIY